MANHYPILFHPQEEIVGPLGNPEEGYFLLSRDVPGGIFFIVMQLTKAEGRRDIIEVGSHNYESAREKALAAYQKDWEERCGSSGEAQSSEPSSSSSDASYHHPFS